jgi:DNA topoisomerase IA
MRVLFTAQDSQTIRDAFGRAKPNSEYARLYAAAVARRQADQIYNLSLTRTATVILGQGARRVIGVGRVKTPTLAIVCKRELEIRNFVPIAYFEIVATAEVAGGQFLIRYAPQDRIVRREIAQDVINAAQGFEGALAVRVEDKRQGPPKLHDLPSLQKLCGSRFGWPASKTLEVAQELYDGQGKKIITYPRAEVRYLPQSLISDVPRMVTGLQVGQSFSAIPVPDPPVIRKGASGTFCDKGLEGASHHAVIPNVNTIDKLRELWPGLSSDEKKLFDVIARAYLAALMPDFRCRQTTATLDVRGFEFRASGRQPIDLGWRAARAGERRRHSGGCQGQLDRYVPVDRLEPKRKAPQAGWQDRLQTGRGSCGSIDGDDEKVSKTQGRRCYASPRPVGSRKAKFDFRYAATDSLRQQGARFEAWRPLSPGWMVCPTWSGSFRIRRARMAVTSGVLPAAPLAPI